MFAFLTMYVEETDKTDMSEDRAYVVLPQFLLTPSAGQFRAVQAGLRYCGVTCYPESVEYLLQTYATPSAIRNASSHLQTVSLSPNETEVQYSARINDAVYRCANVNDEVEQKTIFTNGLSPSIQTIISRYRETKPRRSLTFNALVPLARDEGEAFRAHARGVLEARNARNSNNANATANRLYDTVSFDQTYDEDVNLRG